MLRRRGRSIGWLGNGVTAVSRRSGFNEAKRSEARWKRGEEGRAREASNRLGGMGGWNTPSRKAVGSGWKAVGRPVGIAVGKCSGRLEGGWKGHSAASLSGRVTARSMRERRFDGGPNSCSTILPA
jgi:hypothetical protein